MKYPVCSEFHFTKYIIILHRIIRQNEFCLCSFLTKSLLMFRFLMNNEYMLQRKKWQQCLIKKIWTRRTLNNIYVKCTFLYPIRSTRMGSNNETYWFMDCMYSECIYIGTYITFFIQPLFYFIFFVTLVPNNENKCIHTVTQYLAT